jgi:hypothetical protein
MGILLYSKRFFGCDPQLGSKVVRPIHSKLALLTAKIKFLGLASDTFKCFRIAK